MASAITFIDAAELVRGERKSRRSREEITLFKSVGMALEDLAAVELVFSKRGARKAPAAQPRP